MSELSPTNEISPFLAILWCFYPIGILVFIELLFSSDDDDDDDQGGGLGVNVDEPQLVPLPSGT